MEKKEQFIQKLKNIYPEFSDKLISALDHPKEHFSFRVNTLKTTNEFVVDGLQKLNLEYTKGPLSDVYISKIENKSVLSKSYLVDQGLVYIQSLSSMFAVNNLDVTPDALLLDISAAPGGKSAFASALAQGKLHITALDNNLSRVHQMQKNLDQLGIPFAKCLKMDGVVAQYNSAFMRQFDFVIADVPCSNEGLIREPDKYDFKFWNNKTSKNLSQLQKKLLASAINCARSGAIIVYSTCTYSPLENESIVDWALQKFKNVELLPVILPQNVGLDGFTLFEKHTFDPSLKLTKRILPDTLYDGFYIAKLLVR